MSEEERMELMKKMDDDLEEHFRYTKPGFVEPNEYTSCAVIMRSGPIYKALAMLNLMDQILRNPTQISSYFKMIKIKIKM